MGKYNPTLIDRTNLVGEWLLDGSATDTAGSNNGTATNITWVDSARGYTSECASFNGTSSTITGLYRPPTTTNPDFTINIWFKCNTPASGEGHWVTNYNNVAALIVFGPGSTGIRYYVRDNNNNVTAPTWADTSFFDDKWHMGTFVKNGSTLYLYVDGDEKETTACTVTGHFDSGQAFLMGSRGAAPFTYYNGDLSNCRIEYGTAISQAEIQLLYLEGLRKFGPTNELPSYNLPSTISPVSYWPLNGDALDYAGSNNGTWIGTQGYAPVWGGEGADFNGSSAFYTATYSFTACTISGRVKFDSLSANQTIIQQDDVNSTIYRRFTFVYNNGLGGLDFNFWDGASTYRLMQYSSPVAGVWYHYCFTAGGSNAYLYINNELVDTQAITSGIKNTTADNIWVGVQKFNNVTQSYLNGVQSSINIFTYVLSEADRTKLYNEGAKWIVGNKYEIALMREDLLLHYNGANNGTTTLYDQSGNAKTGTISSTPTYTKRGLHTVIGLSTQSISWSSTTFSTSTCWEKVSGVWEFKVNPSYITSTGVTSGTRDISDIRLYNRTLSTNEQNIIEYGTFMIT